MDKRKIVQIIAYDLIASFLLGVSIVVYAVKANFAPGGVSGLAVILNYLFAWPIGFVTVLINIPIVLATFRKLGAAFFICSVKSVLINALFIDYVVVHLPAYEGSRLVAAILSGVFAGVAYSMLFNIGSSTGGTDFIIAAIAKANPKLSFGMLAFIIDSTVIIASAFVFGEVQAVIYGAVYTVVTSVSLDGATFVMKKLGLPTA
ncbi:MAG: YitT family protein [Clostridia bacterium]|nr:YitT family protein [Clostridia bacterium]